MLLHCIALVIYPSALFFRECIISSQHIHHDRKASKSDSLIGIRNIIVA